MKLLDI